MQLPAAAALSNPSLNPLPKTTLSCTCWGRSEGVWVLPQHRDSHLQRGCQQRCCRAINQPKYYYSFFFAIYQQKYFCCEWTNEHAAWQHLQREVWGYSRASCCLLWGALKKADCWMLQYAGVLWQAWRCTDQGTGNSHQSKEVHWGNFVKHTHTRANLCNISKQAKNTHGDYQFLVCMVNPSIS